ncbi:hypothetical protein CPB86DRAFT_870997 [Serendipita vermifera]|nr:hypothetical protein CPB86DRAFT_870997 [Serendipita vermifera]
MPKAVKKKAQENTEPIKFSDDYPPGSWDFDIQSSDNVIFSFPRSILSYVSPIFKDMFAVGDANVGSNRNPLVVTEDAATLTLFLLFIDPLKESPDLTKETIVPFLEVMNKYQVPQIQERFEKMALGQDGLLQGIYAQEPLLVLSIAERFNWPRIGSFAMQYAAKAHKDRVPTAIKYPLSSTTLMQIMEVRTQRVQDITWAFYRYTRDRVEAITHPEGSHDRNYDPEYESEDSDTCFYDEISNANHDYGKPCALCRAKYQRLGIHVAMQIQVEPSWSALLSVISKRLRKSCSSCNCKLLGNLLSQIPNSPFDPAGDIHWQEEFRGCFKLQDHIASLESKPIQMKSLAPS